MTGIKQPWDDVIPPEERETYAIAGLGGAAGFGKRPALLVIDVQYRSVGDRPMPIREAIKQYPTSCGEAGWHAIAHITKLVKLFREKNWPVIFPHVARKIDHDHGAFSAKIRVSCGFRLRVTNLSVRSPRSLASCFCRRRKRVPSSAPRLQRT